MLYGFLDQIDNRWIIRSRSPFSPDKKSSIKNWLPESWVRGLKKSFVDRASADINKQDGLSRVICRQRGWDLKLTERYDLNYLMGKAYLEDVEKANRR